MILNRTDLRHQMLLVRAYDEQLMSPRVSFAENQKKNRQRQKSIKLFKKKQKMNIFYSSGSKSLAPPTAMESNHFWLWLGWVKAPLTLDLPYSHMPYSQASWQISVYSSFINLPFCACCHFGHLWFLLNLVQAPQTHNNKNQKNKNKNQNTTCLRCLESNAKMPTAHPF